MKAPSVSNNVDDEAKLLLLSDDAKDQCAGKNLLFAAYKEDLMRCIEHHHPGLDAYSQEETLIASIERFGEVLRGDISLLDRALKPALLRTALFVGREVYRKVARRRARLKEELVHSVADSLAGTELGETWAKVADSSFRQRVTDEVQKIANDLKPRQRQIALMFAETWGLGLSEKEAIDELFRTTGERLTRDSFKRAFDEVRKKLREPILKLLIEEGLCPKKLMPKK